MSARRTGTTRRWPGFTLVELLVALVILSLAMAVAVPRFAAGNPALSVRSAARDLVAGLQLARNLAITENRAVSIRFDRAAGAFEVAGRRRELPRGVALTRPDLREDRDDQPIEFRFFPDGSSSGGQIGVVRGAHQLLIDVDWMTGGIATRAAGVGDA